MKKILITTAVLCLAATSAFAASAAQEAAKAGQEAAKAAREVVRPTTPRAGITTGTTVTGQSLMSGAKSVTGQNSSATNLFQINSTGTKQAVAKTDSNGPICTMLTQLPGALSAAVGEGISKGVVSANNGCLPEFTDKVTQERAALGIQAVVGKLGAQNASTASIELRAQALIAASLALSKSTGGSVSESLNTWESICQVKNDNGQAKNCVFNASICNDQVMKAADKAAASL